MKTPTVRARLRAMLPVFGAVLFALAGATPAYTQSARWDPPGGSLGLNQVSELTLVFENCEPTEAFSIPSVDGLVFGRPSVQKSTSGNIVFGGKTQSTVTRTLSLVYPVRPTRRAQIRIPSIKVETNRGEITIPEAVFAVEDAPSGGAGRVTLDDIAAARLETPRNLLWAGEVFPLSYTLSVVRNRYYALDPALQWTPAPFVTEEWSKPNPAETVVRGERRVISTQTTRALAKEPGNFSLGPVTQVVQLIVGTSGLSLFAQPIVEPRQLLTAPLDLTVKPLPPAPSDFTGAVGTFAFTSKIVPTTGAVNEPVTWTLELAGTGNWPDIAGLPGREVSNDFSVVQPKSRRTMKEGSLFEGSLTEDVVLVPTRPGTYTLGPVKFTYFDPKSGTYRTLSTEAVVVSIAGAPTQAPGPAGVPQFALPTPDPAADAGLPAAIPPAPPERLPRDPLPTGALGRQPWPPPTVALACFLSSTLCPLIVWLTLAALRSRANDRARRRREARRRLATILVALRRAGAQPAVLNAHLRLWQHEAAALWEVAHAAPGTPLVHAGVSARARDAAGAWSTLWQEADRALHGREGTLPADWVLRAEGALQAVRVPGWSFLSLFAPRNLFPFLATLAVALSLSVLLPSALGVTAAEAYRRADFAAAENEWRATVASAPTDWAARHNLGLALGQQDRWTEAAAHWAAGYLLFPRSEVTRWDLSLGLQHSGMAPPEFVAFSRGEGRHRIARAASAGEWQLLLVGSSFLLALAVSLLLLHGYRRVGAWAKPVGLGTCLAAVLLAGTATLSLHTYGDLGHPDVALIWKPSLLRSIPTEADATQKTSALSPGSVAVVDRAFLGWSRLVFTGGQTGWTRTEDLLPLYR